MADVLPLPEPRSPRLYVPPDEPPDPPLGATAAPEPPAAEVPPASQASRRRAARRLVRDADLQGSPRPSGRTAALPGTEEKIRVMAGRADAGEGLFHPADLSTADLRGMGFSFEVAPNGAVVWIRPVTEADRLEAIALAHERLRQARQRKAA